MTGDKYNVPSPAALRLRAAGKPRELSGGTGCAPHFELFAGGYPDAHDNRNGSLSAYATSTGSAADLPRP